MAKGNGKLPIYKSYLFKDKDPAIDELRTVIEDHFGRRINPVSLKGVQINGGPTVGCMNQWFYGKTKRPQNATIEAAGRALGYKRVWRQDKGNKEP